MATVEGSITLNELTIAEVDSDPSITGLDLPIGSIAVLGDGVSGKMWIKTGGGTSAWQDMQSGGGPTPTPTDFTFKGHISVASNGSFSVANLSAKVLSFDDRYLEVNGSVRVDSNGSLRVNNGSVTVRSI